MAVNLTDRKELDASPQLAGKEPRRPRIISSLALMFLLPACLTVMPTPTASASSISPASPPSSPTPSVILFSPNVVTLNNPVSPGSPPSPNALTTFTVNLTAYDADGNLLPPTTANPLHIQVYGVPNGVIAPVTTEITSGTAVQFSYNGGFFPNNMEIAAWINDPLGGAALGTTLIVQQNRPACTYGTNSFDLKMISNVPDELKVKAVVGADNPQDFETFAIDTGSLGVIVNKDQLVLGSEVHGPGAKGQKFYDSSGYVFTGNYYLAPVSVELTDGTYVQTNPILVLAIDGVHCHSGYKNCVTPTKPDLHYLGIGFDRNSTGTGDLFDSPSENAALQLTDTQNGIDINGGYVLSTQGVTLGVTSSNSSGFNLITLNPDSTVPGDWLPEPGCYQFTTLPGAPQFCGNLLLDVGISEMFIDLSFDQRPAGSFDSNNRVPAGVGMNILAGSQTQPAMSYSFSAVQPPTQPSGPAPTFAQWVNVSNIFVNTGRRPLLSFDYLYSGQCGQVGFKPLSK